MTSLLHRVAALPCTADAPGPFGTAAVIVICAVSLTAAAGQLRPRIATAVALFAALLAAVADPAPIPKNLLTVHFFDVGQGDATLISTPGGRHLLVDAGPAVQDRFDAGERIVVPALRSLGVSSAIGVATHSDADHIGGMPAVLKALSVTELVDTGHGVQTGAPLHREMMRAAEAARTQVRRTPEICGVRQLDNVRMEVLHPCHGPESFDPAASPNDNSLVLQVRYGKISLLLLGDVSRSIETQLVASGRLGPTDVLKVSHHGSRTGTSPALLDQTEPAAAVISCGRHNRFGMPHRSVLSRLKNRGVRIWRTDRRGTIRLQTDGRVLALSAPYE